MHRSEPPPHFVLDVRLISTSSLASKAEPCRLSRREKKVRADDEENAGDDDRIDIDEEDHEDEDENAGDTTAKSTSTKRTTRTKMR